MHVTTKLLISLDGSCHAQLPTPADLPLLLPTSYGLPTAAALAVTSKRGRTPSRQTSQGRAVQKLP